MKSIILLLLPFLAYGQWVKEQENPGMFEGDMILTPDQQKAVNKGEFGYASTKGNLWPKQIPYSMAAEIVSSSRAVNAINAAIADYHKYTCLRFVKRTDEAGYLHFYRGGGCSSPVGYYRRRNSISLAGGCWYKGTVMHEIAHSLGVYHEQSRPDRDNYVTIRWENIPDSLEYNFRKQKAENIDSLGTPYDFKSVMHYGKTAFGSGRITIQTKDPDMQNVIGQRREFSDIDIKQMNLLYKCSGGGGTVSTKAPTAGPTKAPTAGPTKAPSRAPPTDCKDIVTNCDRYKSKCDNYSSTWTNHMTKYCKKTCNKCNGGGGTVPTKAPTDCKDISSNCGTYKSRCDNYSNAWTKYMAKNCKNTCNKC